MFPLTVKKQQTLGIFEVIYIKAMYISSIK